LIQRIRCSKISTVKPIWVVFKTIQTSKVSSSVPLIIQLINLETQLLVLS